MPTAKFYWYPIDGNGVADNTTGYGTTDLVTIQFDTTMIRELRVINLRDRETEWPGGAPPVVTTTGGKAQVTITIQALHDVSVTDLPTISTFCALQQMESHLLRGGYVGFSFDDTKTGLWPVTDAAPPTGIAMPATGDDTGFHGADWLTWEASPTFVENDIIVIETNLPEFHFNHAVLNSWTDGSPGGAWEVRNATAMRFKSAVELAVIRYHRFWPALYLPDSEVGQVGMVRRVVSGTDHTWSVTLIYEPGVYFPLIEATV